MRNKAVRFPLGLAVAFLLLLVLELSLGLLPLDRYERSFPAGSYPVFVPGEGDRAGWYVTNPHFRTSLNPQAFRRRKAAGTFRIIVVGSSAAKGWPGDDETAFTGFLRRALDGMYPGRFEIVNAAGHSYASHRVLDVLYDIVEFEPDFVLVYNGNNEYVERNVLPAAARGRAAMRVGRYLRGLNLYRAMRLLLHGVSPALFRGPEGPDLTDLRTAPVRRSMPGRDAAIDREVAENYRENVAEMARLLRRRSIPGAFCTVPVNRAAWVPTGADPPPGEPGADRIREDRMQAAFAAYRGGKYEAAAERFRVAAELSPRNATARFFRGDSLRRTGRYEEARDELASACEFDARPIRELPSFGPILAAECARYDVPVVDLAGAFERQSGKNLVGLDLFIDYCHPNEAGHKLIARAVLEEMVRIAPVRGIDVGAASERIRTDASAASRFLGPAVLYAQGMTHQNNGDLAGAERLYRECLKGKPDFPEALYNLAAVRYRLGDRREAEEFARRSLELDPELQESRMMMAVIRLQQGRLPEAREHAERLLRQNPGRPDAAGILRRIEDAEAARAGGLRP